MVSTGCAKRGCNESENSSYRTGGNNQRQEVGYTVTSNNRTVAAAEGGERTTIKILVRCASLATLAVFHRSEQGGNYQ